VEIEQKCENHMEMSKSNKNIEIEQKCPIRSCGKRTEMSKWNKALKWNKNAEIETKIWSLNKNVKFDHLEVEQEYWNETKM